MTSSEKEELRRAKIAVGLTPAQADAVIADQESWDKDPEHPANKKPAAAAEAEGAKGEPKKPKATA